MCVGQTFRLRSSVDRSRHCEIAPVARSVWQQEYKPQTWLRNRYSGNDLSARGEDSVKSTNSSGSVKSIGDRISGAGKRVSGKFADAVDSLSHRPRRDQSERLELAAADEMTDVADWTPRASLDAGP